VHRDALHERSSGLGIVVPADQVAAQLVLAGAEPSVVRVIEKVQITFPNPTTLPL